MDLRWANSRSLKILLLALSVNTVVKADECLTYAQKSVEQQDRNLFNLCGFHGSQWSSDLNRWRNECRSMSSKDRQYRLSMREGFLSQCPSVSYNRTGRNHQHKLLSALLKAVQTGNLQRTALLVEAGVNLAEQPSWLAASPLYVAVKNNQFQLARFLVRNGAKPYLLARGEINILSLLLRRQEVNYGLFELLLQNNANPNDAEGNRNIEYPLVTAAARGDFRLVELLLRYKADPNLYRERSALQLAVEQDHYPIARALIQYGANPNLGINGKRCEGVMALDLAFRNAQERVIDLLMDNHALAQRECR